jgi:trimeric autotransporter adhesin
MRMFSTAFYSLAMACSALGQTYTIKTLAGGGWPERVPALSVGLLDASGLASDRAGNIYVSISGFVLRLDSAGNLTRIAGDGVCRYNGDYGPAATAGICRPTGLAVDAAGNLYFADPEDHVVRKVSNGIITTIAGTGTKGYKGDNGSATSAQLARPDALALDSAGNLYIADTESSVVRKVAGGTITTVAGGGSYSPGDGRSATTVLLDEPLALAVDSAGSLYIAEGNTVRKVSNGIITTVAGTPYIGGKDGDNIPATSATLSPSGLAVDSSGNAYVSEAGRGRIRKVSNGIITTIAGTGVRGHSGDGGPATSAQLGAPSALAVGPNDELYVADGVGNGPGTWIRKISKGLITTVAGNGRNETSGDCTDIFGADDNGSATSAIFCNPTGIAVDTSGRVYVVDAAFSVIREISNGTIRTIAGNWSSSDPIADNIPATQASLRTPLDVAVDADGNAFVTDWDHGRVRKISNGMITTVAGGGTASGNNIAATSVDLDDPERVAVDSSGSVYFTDGNTIRKVSGGIITTVAGNGTEGYSGDNGPAINAQLNSLRGVAVDTSGNIYVADAGNSRIRKISNGIITTIAGNGTAGYGGDNGPAVGAQLNGPNGVAVDANGSVYVADTDNSRIRRISNGIITTIAGNGTAAYGGDGGPAVSAKLNWPSGIAVDAAGNVYIADSYNSRVRVLVPSGSATCAYSLDSQTLGVAASGGAVIVKVTTVSGCTWTASSGASWIAATTGTSGSGNGTATFTAAANTSSSVRTGILTVAGQTIYVNQAAAGQAASSLVSLTSGGIVNAASGATTIAPGSFISIFGQNLSDVTDTWGSAITDGLTLPTALRGVRVRINGKDCYVYFVSPGQINVLTPPDTATGPVLVEVVTTHGTAAAMVQMSQASPGWFTYAAQGKTYVAALTIPDNLLAAPVGAVPGAASRPAQAGEYVQLYATGLGATNPQYPAGQVLTTAYPVADLSKIKVTVGGQVAPVAFAGMVSPGLYQVNIRVPDDVASGTLPVVLSVGGQASQTNALVTFK